MKVISVFTNNIYLNIVYLEEHPNNYLVINGKYFTYHLLFTRG
jgi:hypothetical protein